MSEENLNLLEIKKDHNDYRIITLYATDDHMQGYLSVQLLPGGGVTREEIDAFFQEAELSFGIIQETIEDIIATCDRGQNVDKALIAEGREKEDGTDGFMKWIKRPTGMHDLALKDISEDAAINYKEIMGVENVREGELIAEYVPPVEGVGGEDIFGRVTPPKDSKDFIFKCGANVTYDEAALMIYADTFGHITFENKVIDVSQIFTVSGNIDMRTGNVKFIGRLEVSGDVQDDFIVDADKGIFVGGTAESCVLKSKSDIVIKGGVTGKEKGVIECDGNVFARFLDEVTVTSGEDIIIDNEIINSKVFALGRVIIRTGVIIGSEVVALKGIVAKNIGSDLGVKTRVTAGLDYHFAEKLYELNHDLMQAQQKQQAVMDKLGPLLERALKGAGINTTQREEVEEMWEETRTLQKKIIKLERESGDISQIFSDYALPLIEINEKVFPGTLFVVDKFDAQVSKEMTGPLMVEPDIENRTVRIASQKEKSPIMEDPIRYPEWLAMGRKKKMTKKHYTFEQIEELYKRFNPTAMNVEGMVAVVAEDNLSMLNLITKALQKKGFTVYQAQDGLDALKLIRENDPDLVLLDIQMPKVTGLSILEALRRDERFGETPVILVTGSKQKQDIVLAHKLKASGYIVKPFKMEDLLAKVAEVMNK